MVRDWVRLGVGVGVGVGVRVRVRVRVGVRGRVSRAWASSPRGDPTCTRCRQSRWGPSAASRRRRRARVQRDACPAPVSLVVGSWVGLRVRVRVGVRGRGRAGVRDRGRVRSPS